MISRFERILQWLQKELEDELGSAVPVYRDRLEMFTRREGQCILLASGQIQPQSDGAPSIDCRQQWRMEFAASIYVPGIMPVEGEEPLGINATADRLRCQVHEVVMRDRDMNGLAMDVMPAGFYPMAESNDQEGWLVCAYSAMVSTAYNSVVADGP